MNFVFLEKFTNSYFNPLGFVVFSFYWVWDVVQALPAQLLYQEARLIFLQPGASEVIFKQRGD
jgi:hypothetical protein